MRIVFKQLEACLQIIKITIVKKLHLKVAGQSLVAKRKEFPLVFLK
jgi:hypothetical protein